MKYVIVDNSAAAVKVGEAIRSEEATSSLIVISREKYEAYSPILTTYLMEIKEKFMVIALYWKITDSYDLKIITLISADKGKDGTY